MSTENTVIQSRITAMFRRDCVFAYGFVVALWLVYAFVFFTLIEISPVVNEPLLKFPLFVIGILVLTYNTASITAMIIHHKKDKDFIYAVDLQYLDLMKQSVHKNDGDHHMNPSE